MLFFVHAQTILEVIGIFAQFHCLSSYRNDLERKDFVSKRPVTDESPVNRTRLIQFFFHQVSTA